MTDEPLSSGNRPMKASPETIVPPSEAGADGKGGETPKASKSEEVVAEKDGRAKADASVSNADQQNTDLPVERYTNTKQNIALINDPKNGPRFTLTKRESGLIEGEVARTEKTPRTEPTPQRDRHRHDLSPSGRVPNPAREDVEQENAEAGKTPPPQAGTPAATVAGAASGAPAETAETQPDAGFSTSRPMGFNGVPPAAEPPSKVPVDSSKTYVGPNGTYYDESWRWMDWRGTKRSWNWAAALTFGHWFAYRRLYWQAAVYAVWLALLTAGLVNNLHVALVAGLLVLTFVLTGIYANILYFQAFRRAVAHVTERGEGSYDELKKQLANAGGIRPKAPFMMLGLTIAGMALALAGTYVLRGGFLVNIWPF